MNHTKTIGDLFAALAEVIDEKEFVKAAIKADIASTITSTRIDAGLSQSDLAEKVGRTQSTISKWEAGTANFTIDLLVDIAADLDLDLTVKLKKHTKVIAFKSSNMRRPGSYSTPTRGSKRPPITGGYYAARSCDHKEFGEYEGVL